MFDYEFVLSLRRQEWISNCKKYQREIFRFQDFVLIRSAVATHCSLQVTGKSRARFLAMAGWWNCRELDKEEKAVETHISTVRRVDEQAHLICHLSVLLGPKVIQSRQGIPP